MSGCLLPALFAAHHGVGMAPHLHVPSGMASVDRIAIPPPTSDKLVLGEPLENRFDSTNFSVQWSEPSVDTTAAEVAAEALELAWEVLVLDQGLGPPKTAEWAKILVYLDPYLSGTGVTTGVETDTNPDGAPIIYLNPTYIEQPDFFRSVAVHEFGHAIQFQYRDWYGGSESEPWFWEATSEWMTEVVNPDWNQYAWSSSWYAAAPGLAFDSMEDFHQYGMVLLNAYIDEYRGGPQVVWSIWTTNEGREWIDEIERVLQAPAIDIWSEFVGAYSAQALVDSEHYEMPDPAARTGEIVGHLGSAYIELGQAHGSVQLNEGRGTMVRDGRWVAFNDFVDIPDGEGPVGVVVTNPDTGPLRYSVSVIEDALAEDTGDAVEAGTQADAGSVVGGGTVESKSGCSCTTQTNTNPAWPVAIFALVFGIRYRSWSQEEYRRP